MVLDPSPTSSNIPIPDPTIRTVEQLNAAVIGLKELHEVRLNAMDKAQTLFHEDITRVPTEVQKATTSLKDLILEMFATINEKFRGVEKQFIERDVRSDKTAELNQKALDAALLTAEKAVSKQQESFTVATTKSEASFTKQIEALGVQLTGISKTNDDKISDLRSSIARIDNAVAAITAKGIGVREVTTDKHNIVVEKQGSHNLIIGIVALAASILIGSLGIIVVIFLHSPLPVK